MYNILQQRYLHRYGTYLDQLQLVQDQISAIFSQSAVVCPHKHNAIRLALMSYLTRRGMLGNNNLCTALLSMNDPSHEELLEFLNATKQVLEESRDKVIRASQDIIISKRKKGVFISPRFSKE